MSNNVNKKYTSQELNAMSNDELARLGTELDEVTVAYRKERFPIANDPAEKRAVNIVGVWFLLGIIFAVAFLGVYLFWPGTTRDSASRACGCTLCTRRCWV